MKMKLNLDELDVESFDPMPAEEGNAPGTLRGYLGTQEPFTCDSCEEETCGGTCTCDPSCGGTCTCGTSCGGTCNTCGSTCGGLTCDSTDPCNTCPSCPFPFCG